MPWRRSADCGGGVVGRSMGLGGLRACDLSVGGVCTVGWTLGLSWRSPHVKTYVTLHLRFHTFIRHVAPCAIWARAAALAAARTLQLGVALSHPSVNPLAAHRIKAFRQLVQHDGGSLRLHFPDEDVGFVYHRGTKITRPFASSGLPSLRLPVLEEAVES